MSKVVIRQSKLVPLHLKGTTVGVFVDGVTYNLDFKTGEDFVYCDDPEGFVECMEEEYADTYSCAIVDADGVIVVDREPGPSNSFKLPSKKKGKRK